MPAGVAQLNAVSLVEVEKPPVIAEFDPYHLEKVYADSGSEGQVESLEISVFIVVVLFVGYVQNIPSSGGGDTYIEPRTGESEDVKEVGHVETVLEIDRDEKVLPMIPGGCTCDSIIME